MTPEPIGILNGQGGELLWEIIQRQGGSIDFPKNSNFSMLMALERLADDGFLESLAETADTITYRIVS
jgi:hypothetical protein